MALDEQLKNLADLHSQGALTDSEFDAAKRRLLNKGVEPTAPGIEHPRLSQYQPRPTTNGLAITAFILTLLIPLVGSIIGLVLGYRAKQQIDESNGREGGRGLAIAAIVLGWIGVAVPAALLAVNAAVVSNRGQQVYTGDAPPSSCSEEYLVWVDEDNYRAYISASEAGPEDTPAYTHLDGVPAQLQCGPFAGDQPWLRQWMRDNGYEPRGHNLSFGYYIIGFAPD